MGMGSAFMAPLGVSAAGDTSARPSSMAQPPSKPRRPRGELIAGILADAFAGMLGQQGPMAAQWGREREQEREQVQWGLQRRGRLEDYEAQKQIDQRYQVPDVSPMERDARAWAAMSPELQNAYRAAQAAKPQFIPDGMGGGQWVQPPMPGRPAAPPPGVTFTPLPDGGPASAPETFRFP